MGRNDLVKKGIIYPFLYIFCDIMNKNCIPIIVVAIILISGVSVALEENLPLIPAGYYGSIIINGQPASPGIKIIAMMGGEERGDITTTMIGSYGSPEGSSPKLGVGGFQGENGSIVTFYVSGVAAKETTQWISGDVREVDLTFTLPTGPGGGPDGGGGPGGGGGGGISSGENVSNIDVKECYDMEVFKDRLTSFKYSHVLNPIRFINITGNINAGVITSCVEVLKDTSSLVTSDAPGIVYKNMNIWVGLKDFATPNNIKDARIMFKVNNSWLTNNNVAGNQLKLLKWDGSKWVTLDTKEIRKDGTNTYFESGTDSFSSFAISGITEIVVTPTPGPAPSPGVTGTPAPPVKPPVSWDWLLYLLVVIIIGAAAYFFIIKKK